MKRVLESRDFVSALTVVVVVLVVMLGLEVVEPNYFLWDDNASYFLPNYVYNWRSVVERKTIPFINFYQYLGHRHVGASQTSVFYPPVYLAVFLSKVFFGNVYSTIDIFVIGHLIASGVGMFLLLRKLAVRRELSVLGSLVWATFPFLVVVSKSWIVVSFTAMSLPFTFLILMHLLDDPSLKKVILLSFVKVLFFSQGFVQYFVVLSVFEVLFVLLVVGRLWKEKKKFINYYVLSHIFFLILITPLLLSLVFTQGMSFERSSGLDLGHILYSVFPLKGLLWHQLLPFHFSMFHEMFMHIYFVGPIILFPFFLLSKSLRKAVLVGKRRVFLVLSLIAFLSSTVLYGAVAVLPIFNLFRWPFRHYLFFLFFFVIGVFLFIEFIYRKKGVVFRWLALSMALGSLVLNIALVFHSKGSEHTRSPYTVRFPPSEYMSLLDPSRGRVFTYNVKGRNSGRIAKFLTFNFATLYGFNHLGGYEPLISDLNNALGLGLHYSSDYSREFSTELLDYLIFWSVRYVVAEDVYENLADLDSFSVLQRIYQADGVVVYENTEALPLVYFKDNPEEKLDFEFGVNEVRIYPNIDRERTVMVTVAPIKGYSYSLDGRAFVKINQESDKPVKLLVPGGAKEVVLRYTDEAFMLGLKVSVVFWLIVVVSMVGWYLSRIRSA